MGMRDEKRPLPNVEFVAHRWSEQYESGVTYALEVGGVSISLDEKVAEKIMLAMGFGDLVWEVDWSKVGHTFDHTKAIQPRIRSFSRSLTPVFPTRVEAEAAVAKEIQSRIAALQKLGS
jgi:hypothetical protein